MNYYYKSKITNEDINLKVYKYSGDKELIWGYFKEHHYLSQDLNKASTVYLLYWNDILVGFNAVLPIPSGNIKYSYRGHRTVILPDYQGLGIGTKFVDFVAQYYVNNGLKYNTRCSHTKMRGYMDRSNKWIPTSHNNKKQDPNTNIKPKNEQFLLKRICGAYEYMGEDYVNKEHINIHIDYSDKNIDDFDLDLIRQDLSLLKEKYYITVITGNINDSSELENICKDLGIRTQMLYYRGKLISKYKNKKILTKWDKKFSDKVRKYYKLDIDL